MKKRNKAILNKFLLTILAVLIIFHSIPIDTLAFANSSKDSETEKVEVLVEEDIEGGKKESNLDILKEQEDIDTNIDKTLMNIDDKNKTENIINQINDREGTRLLTDISIINSVKFFKNDIEVNGEVTASPKDVIKFVYNINIPNYDDDVREGDYIEFEVPNGFILNSVMGALKEYGTIEQNGANARLTFSSDIEVFEGARGALEFTKILESSEEINIMTSTGQESLTVTVGDIGITEPLYKEKINIEKASINGEGRDIQTLFPDAKIIDAVKFYLNGIEVSGEAEAGSDDVLKILYNWSIPNDILHVDELKAGDYIEIDQPKGITSIESNGNLGDYGTYTFSNGKLRLVFNSLIETEENISGAVEFTQMINTYLETGVKEITVPVPGSEELLILNVKPASGSSISKSTSGITRDDKVFWEVSVNTEMNEIVSGAKVVDILPEGLKLDSIKVYEQFIDLDGNVISRGDEATGVNIEDSTVIFDGSQGRKSYVILYETSFDSDLIPANGGELKFENIAEFTNGGEPLEARATARRTYERFVTKSNSKPNETLGSHIYEWSISYNNNSKKLPAETWLQDELPEESNSTIIKESIKIYKEDGSELDQSYYSITHTNDRNFKMTLNKEIDFVLKIEYDTKYNGIVSGNTKPSFKNYVTTSEGLSTEGSGTISEQGLSKWGDINYDTREVLWVIEVNKAMYYMENWSLKDTFSQGQKYVVDSFSIDGFSEDDYELELSEDGLEVSLNAPTSKKFYIRYKTKFEPLELLKDDEGRAKVINTATHKWTDVNRNLHETTREASYPIEVDFVMDSSKNGFYNGRTKEITWTVVSNYRQEKLIGASIVDKIDPSQEYVSGSAKLIEVDIASNGSVNLGEEVRGADIIEPGEDGILKVNLPEGKNLSYALVFKTHLKDQVIVNPYVNTAFYTNAGREQEVTVQVSVANAGNHLEKSALLKEINRITWGIAVNKSQSTISDLKIIDKPSNNQIISKDSIKVYNAIANPDNSGLFTKGELADIDYTVDLVMDNETGEQTLTIKFNETIDTAYFIEYFADIDPTNDSGSEPVSNSVKLDGTGTETINSEKNVNEVVITTGATGQGETTSVTLEKVDSENTDLKLAGVKLELWSTKKGVKNVKLREGITDENGILNFGGLRTETDYLIYEVEAGKGYTISEELLNGKKIRLQNSKDVGNLIQVGNELSSFSFKKLASNNGQGLKDAEFIIKMGDKFYGGLNSTREVIWVESQEEAMILKSDSEGLVLIRGLDEENYSIVEIKAPEGYVPIGDEVEFTVIRNSDGTLGLVDSIDDIINQRIEHVDVLVTKKWDDGENRDGIRPESITINLLADGEVAEVVVLSEENEWTRIFRNLPKYNDADKKIQYQVEELAVSGYESQIESKENSFTITNTHIPEVIDIEGEKTWNDHNNIYGRRPQFIEIELYRTIDSKTEKIDEVEVSSDNDGNWKYIFSELAKYNKGVEIIYTINEKPVAHYRASIDGFNVENSYIPPIYPPEDPEDELPVYPPEDPEDKLPVYPPEDPEDKLPVYPPEDPEDKLPVHPSKDPSVTPPVNLKDDEEITEVIPSIGEEDTLKPNTKDLKISKDKYTAKLPRTGVANMSLFLVSGTSMILAGVWVFKKKDK